MTNFIFIILFLIMSLLGAPGFLVAEEKGSSFWVSAWPGTTTQADRFVRPWRLATDFLQKELRYVSPIQNRYVAGVKPSFSELVKEFRAADKRDLLPCPRDGLVAALQMAARGRTGPLLVISDGVRVRMMELRFDREKLKASVTKP